MKTAAEKRKMSALEKVLVKKLQNSKKGVWMLEKSLASR